MSFVEFRVTDLAPFVDCLWVLAHDEVGESRSAILPDGCVEVTMRLAGGFEVGPARGARGASETSPSRSAVRVIGLAAAPIPARYRGPVRIAGVRLTPAGAMRILGPALGDLAGGAGDGDALLPGHAARLLDGAEALSGTGDRAPLEAALHDSLRRARRVDVRLERAATLLATAAREGASPGIAEVARAVGLSTRHLDRGFEARLGVPPRLIARVARFRRAFELGMAGGRGAWAAIAARTGYADQSHLVREFRELGGWPPERFRAAFEARDG
jgi:AraC-like DNA-binding protein